MVNNRDSKYSIFRIKSIEFMIEKLENYYNDIDSTIPLEKEFQL